MFSTKPRTSPRKRVGFGLLISALLASLLSAIANAPAASAGDIWASCNTGISNTASTYVTVDSSVAGKCLITFKTTQTFTVPAGVTAINEALVVGGGGGGGFGNNGGGGGAGLVQYRNTDLSLLAPTQTVTTTQLVITIGAGGDDGWVGPSTWQKGANGNPTTITTQTGAVIIRAGGGGGGCGNNGSNSGWEGSAGGACTADTAAKAAGTVATTTGWTKYANAGYSGNAAGGGGAGAAATSGTGGAGITLFGLSVGGGGGGWNGSTTNGGFGGGGGALGSCCYSNANGGTSTGSDGTANTGGGGGAGRKGGSGVVKLSYTIPTKAPSAPASVSASAAAGGLAVTWSAPTDLGNNTVTGYQVEYSTTGTGTWTVASSTVGASTYSYSITGLDGLTAYYVRVAAKYSGGLGAYGYPWIKIYSTSTPNRTSGLITYDSGFGLSGGAATTNASTAFSRIRYSMAATYDSTAKYVDADFYRTLGSASSTSTTFDTISKLQVPTTSGTGSQFVIQANVSDLNILTNASEVKSGQGLSGRLEIWPWDYGTPAVTPFAERTSGTYDDADTQSAGGSYGSFQLHNLSSSPKETTFAWNRHDAGQTAEIGFGNSPSGNSDWTFCSNPTATCTGRTAFNLSVYINAPTTTLAGTALTPSFGASTPTRDGFTVQISNYDSLYTWVGTSSAGGSVVVSNTGLVTVTGVAANTSSTVTVTTTRTNYSTGTNSTSATSLAAPTMTAPTSGLTGIAMTAYSLTLSAATGGTGPYSYSLSAGSLPPGLSLSGRVISGTPTTAGTYSGIKITATDVNSATGQSPAFTITINSGTQLTLSVATTFGTGGQPLALSTRGGSGTGAVTYAVRNGAGTTCSLTGSSLTATTSPGASGICYVTATKAADAAFTSAKISSEATVFFTPYVPVITQGTTCSAGSAGSGSTGIGTTGCQVLAPVTTTAGDSGAAPKITALSVTSGLIGASVVITGTGFASATKVQFGAKSTTTFTLGAGNTTITVAVPTGATTGRVMVFSPTGTAMASQIFTVITPDTRAPAFQSGNVNTSSPTLLTLNFDESLANSGLAESAFGVSVAGVTRSVSSIAISGTTITLTLSSAVTTGQAVVFTYTSPGDATSIQDAAGNKTATITATALLNTL